MAPRIDRNKTRPTLRKLRVFAFDPSLSQQIRTAGINQVTIGLPWNDRLEIGPTDEYLEVVDVDPASERCYPPVDLDDPYLLAQDGLAPSEGNPQFHQQMAYAVARTTIINFEAALGRRVLWSARQYKDADGKIQDEFVPHLRIYPHALRESNAFYDPVKKALLFGYFPASTTDPGANLPGGTVFACLSHDVIAHETTHAILDGIHPRFIEPSNVDVFALHEAFADIVALFQHFSFPDVLRHQVAATQGDLQRQNLLAQLAQQFGQAIGQYGALRDALGTVDPVTKEWKAKKPDPQQLGQTTEPHARGAILVAAMFDAFLAIYKWRVADLLRIATGGSGVLQPGELHPDLVSRLAQEAAKTAQHVLGMAIRALDYCPPVDVTFGDYLRALITADVDFVSDDRLNYRLAFIEAFRQRGIYPLDVRSLSEESLVWQTPGGIDQNKLQRALGGAASLRRLAPDWGLNSDRKALYDQHLRNQAWLHRRFIDPSLCDAAEAVGLLLREDAPKGIYRKGTLPALEVHSVRPTRRVGPDGDELTDLVIEMTQRRRGYKDPNVQAKVDSGEIDEPPDFIFRGGCTLLVDLETGLVRYSIGKGVTSERRLQAERDYLAGPANPSLQLTYFGDPRQSFHAEGGQASRADAFALLHRVKPEEMI